LEFFQGKFVEHDDANPTSADDVVQGIWIDTDGDGIKEFYKTAADVPKSAGTIVESEDLYLHKPQHTPLSHDDIFEKDGDGNINKEAGKESFFKKFGIDKEDAD
jgi:hypothetical protein